MNKDTPTALHAERKLQRKRLQALENRDFPEARIWLEQVLQPFYSDPALLKMKDNTLTELRAFFCEDIWDSYRSRLNAARTLARKMLTDNLPVNHSSAPENRNPSVHEINSLGQRLYDAATAEEIALFKEAVTDLPHSKKIDTEGANHDPCHDQRQATWIEDMILATERGRGSISR